MADSLSPSAVPWRWVSDSGPARLVDARGDTVLWITQDESVDAEPVVRCAVAALPELLFALRGLARAVGDPECSAAGLWERLAAARLALTHAGFRIE